MFNLYFSMSILWKLSSYLFCLLQKGKFGFEAVCSNFLLPPWSKSKYTEQFQGFLLTRKHQKAKCNDSRNPAVADKLA